MDLSQSNTRKNGNNKATNPKVLQLMVTLALGMPTTMNKVVNQNQQMIMSTSFVCQQIDMGINNLMYQISRQLAKIVKSILQNKMYNVREQEQKQLQVEVPSVSLFSVYQQA